VRQTVLSALLGLAFATQAAFADDAARPTLGEPALPALGFAKCRSLGARMIEIPGSGTCIRIGGGVTSDVTVADGDVSLSTRARLIFNTATPTAHGALRTSVIMTARTSGALFADSEDDGASASSFSLSRAFIQFHGLTVGRTKSFFDAPAIQGFDKALVSSRSSDLIGYSLHFSPQLTGSLAVETSKRRFGFALSDGTFRDVSGTADVPDITSTITASHGGLRLQSSGVLRLRDPGGDSINQFGFALQGAVNYSFTDRLTPMQRFDGVEVKKGPTISFSAAYGRGAASYLGFGGDIPDGGCSLTICGLSEGWSAAAGVFAPWSENLSSTLTASYGNIRPMPGAPLYEELRLSGNLVYQPGTVWKVGAELSYRGQAGRSGSIRAQPEFLPRLRFQADF
jgi:hypothetical protein